MILVKFVSFTTLPDKFGLTSFDTQDLSCSIEGSARNVQFSCIRNAILSAVQQPDDLNIRESELCPKQRFSSYKKLEQNPIFGITINLKVY